MEYKAIVDSPLISGEALLSVEENSLVISSLMETAELRYYEIDAVRTADYKVFVITDYGKFIFEKMGQWCEPFFLALRNAYDKEMRKALFVSGEPAFTAKGDFIYLEKEDVLNAGSEEGIPVNAGSADIEVYDNSVCFLTGDINSRRVPLCFVGGINAGDFEFKFVLDNGDWYICRKLGYETDLFKKAVSDRIRYSREKSYALLQETDPGLSAVQLNILSEKMVEGAAVSVSFISDTSPSLITSIETVISESRIGDTYGGLKANSSEMFVGIKKTESTDDIMIWIIASSHSGETCAVEFAGGDDDAAATFIYKYKGDFNIFAGKLNHALEAIEFKKDIVRMSEDDFKNPENSAYALAIKVNKALKLVRNCYGHRLIHNSADSWLRNLLANFS